MFDADSTIIRNEVIELIADEAGRGAEVAAATEAAMRGEVDFATSLRSRVQELTGVPVASFARVLSRVEPTPGVHELIAAIQERAMEHLEAPILRVTGFDTPFPYTLEHEYLPNADRVLGAVRQTLEW